MHAQTWEEEGRVVEGVGPVVGDWGVGEEDLVVEGWVGEGYIPYQTHQY